MTERYFSKFFGTLHPLFEVVKREKRRYLIPFFAHFLFQFGAALFEGFTFAFIFAALSLLGGINTPIYTFNNILSKFYIPFALSEENQFVNFVTFFLCAITIQILKCLFTFFAAISFTFFINHIQMGLLEKFRKQLFSFSFPFISNMKTGELLSLIKMPFDSMYSFMVSFSGLCQSTIFIIVLSSLLFYISPLFTLVVGVIIACTVFFQRSLITVIKTRSIEYSEHITEYMRVFSQTINGMRLIIVYHRFQYINKILTDCIQNTINSIIRLTIRSNSLQQLNELISLSVIAICAIIGFLLLQKSETLGISILITYLTVLLRMANRVPQIMSGLGGLAHSWGEITRLMNILNTENKQYALDGHKPIAPLAAEISFQEIFHSYDDKRIVLENINFTIPKGKTIAFVGKSGAGKSTIVDLLVRLYEPKSGLITIDGIPLSEIKLETWRNQLGVVSQDTFIFNDTIYNNICFGMENIEKEQIYRIAEISGCKEMIERLSNGYETILGERGYRLSGGERQRIALARALLRNPEVIILDEATSALDTRTERYIMDAIESFHGRKTILLIAHRLSTIIDSDEILVLDHGRIIERGTHNSLLALDGVYTEMWEAQTKTSDKGIEVIG